MPTCLQKMVKWLHIQPIVYYFGVVALTLPNKYVIDLSEKE